MLPGQECDDAIGFAQLVLANHHRLISIQPHRAIFARTPDSSPPTRAANSRSPLTAGHLDTDTTEPDTRREPPLDLTTKTTQHTAIATRDTADAGAHLRRRNETARSFSAVGASRQCGAKSNMDA
ncbi:hypothetical protein GCM10011591_38350 [Nocardia camponoti]|uniref:Uncharacterized protein n=1 Tax=Nocardia camponoti TaxID=1616106 RepID=A0A917VCE6_9NOCA|nr:hypothetical protein GCM10011591_38350 [Nocardia camponoti]